MKRTSAIVAVLVAVGALLAAGPANAGASNVTVSQLKRGFKKATGQTLVVDRARSNPGHYTAFNLGVQTATRQARYGTFTIFLVSGSDAAGDVERLLADPRTGEPRPAREGRHPLGEGRQPDRHRDLDGEAPLRVEPRHLVDDGVARQEDRQDLAHAPQGADVGREGRLSRTIEGRRLTTTRLRRPPSRRTVAAASCAVPLGGPRRWREHEGTSHTPGTRRASPPPAARARRPRPAAEARGRGELAERHPKTGPFAAPRNAVRGDAEGHDYEATPDV